MKLQDTGFDVQVQGEEDSTDFSVAMNGKAFRVLSSGLYQDKIGSIIREICSNAYDAHVMAGCPEKPFELHLPDAYEPWFSVQDFGVGLSPEDIKVVFTRYFESTKDSSNDTIGAFGLGAKSPFSYTDQFSVVSNYNGTQTSYSAYLKADGTPTISKMLEAVTAESNGVEIRMSAKQSDLDQFSAKAGEQLRFFKVKPLVTNSTSRFRGIPDEFEGKEVQLQTSTSRLYKGGSGITIVQGNVGYPLSIQNFNSLCKDTDISAFLNVLWSAGTCVMDFPIGQISVTASRESLEYTQQTVDNIAKALKELQVEVAVEFDKMLKGCKTNWEIACTINESSALVKNSDVKDYALSGQAKIMQQRGYNSGFELPLLHPLGQFRKKGYRETLLKESCTGFFVATKDLKIYTVAAETKHIRSRFKNLLLGYGANVYFCVESHKQKFSDLLGGFDNFVKLEDQPFVKPVRTASHSVRTTFYEATVNRDNTYVTLDKQSEVFADYIEEEPFCVVAQYRGSTSWETDRKILKLNAMKLWGDVPKVIAVAENRLAKLKAMDGHVDIDDFLKEKEEEFAGKLKTYNKRKAISKALIHLPDRFAQPEFAGLDLHKLARIKSKVSLHCNALQRLAEATDVNSNVYMQAKMKAELSKYPVLSLGNWQSLDNDTLLKYLKV